MTATSEPLHPPLPPGGRIAGEGERRKRAEFGPDPPSGRFWPSGRLVGRTATAASATSAVYAAGNTGLLGLILPGCSATAVAATVPSAPLRLP
ncbi:hypothetical protein NDU88_001258 [Pleurodeles waltl]|uniref:Uncharacterized protein n=1 Tax=Pleurodeles waltl TaxID=8319 RepID=A0AAV7U6E3_PLEWA|nr:hypothetical protein NDU88_001258 [Pleurodeles waltl]